MGIHILELSIIGNIAGDIQDISTVFNKSKSLGVKMGFKTKSKWSLKYTIQQNDAALTPSLVSVA